MGDYRALLKLAHTSFKSGEWVTEQDEEDLEDWVAAVTREFSDSTACLPRVFAVTRDGAARYSIDAGRTQVW